MSAAKAATTATAAATAVTTPADVTFNFKGKLALVTGSTIGIGYAIAQAFVKAGADVVINGRDTKTVDAVVAKLSAERADAKSQTVYAGATDVGTAAGCKELLKKLETIGKPVDFLINNVSIFSAKEWTEYSDDEWLNYFNINIMSCVRLTRAYLPIMLKRNSGRVIIISSECGLRPIGAMIPYSMTKGAQINLARGLAELTHGTNVTVNSLLPGPTATEGVTAYLESRLPLENAELTKAGKPPITVDQLRQQYCKTTEPTSIIERFIEPVEVANATLYLCTSLAAPINGSSQRVEGGIVRHL